jgi:hypothetical protein
VRTKFVGMYVVLTVEEPESLLPPGCTYTWYDVVEVVALDTVGSTCLCVLSLYHTVRTVQYSTTIHSTVTQQDYSVLVTHVVVSCSFPYNKCCRLESSTIQWYGTGVPWKIRQ